MIEKNIDLQIIWTLPLILSENCGLRLFFGLELWFRMEYQTYLEISPWITQTYMQEISQTGIYSPEITLVDVKIL
jgi:hypothetical protein